MITSRWRWSLALLVLVLTAAADLVPAGGLSDVLGTVVSIDVEKRVIVVREKLSSGDGKDITMTVTPKATIRIGRREITLEDLSPGDVVAVAFSQGKGGAVADYIEKKVPANQKP